MKQIQMNKSKNLSVNDAYDLFIRKCRVKNLSQASIVSYENKIHPFVDYCEGGLISAVTIDTVDGFTNHLKTEHNVNDVSVVHSMNLFTDCGINPKKRRINLASFEAYRALLLSHKTANLDIRPENILLIKDVKSVFKDKVMYVGLKDKKLFTEEKEMTIENKIWDGQSLIDKSLMGDYQDKGMLLLRHKFFKSCCFNSNIQQWFKDNHITDVSQLNGITTAKRIEDIKFITTPSSIKYCKFGDTENWFYDWLKQISKKNIPFGIVKYEKPTKYFGGKLVRTHYQILNTLQITKNKITELLQQTLDYIELLRKDPLAMYHYCEATSDDEDSDLMMNVKADVIYRMMKLNMSFKDTKLYKHLAKNVIESIRADIKCGRILVNGNYSILF